MQRPLRGLNSEASEDSSHRRQDEEVRNRDEKCKCKVDSALLLPLLGGIAATTGSDLQQEEQQKVVRSAPGSAQETALVGNHCQKVS